MECVLSKDQHTQLSWIAELLRRDVGEILVAHAMAQISEMQDGGAGTLRTATNACRWFVDNRRLIPVDRMPEEVSWDHDGPLSPHPERGETSPIAAELDGVKVDRFEPVDGVVRRVSQ